MKNTFTSLLFVTLMILFGNAGAQIINATSTSTSSSTSSAAAPGNPAVFGNGFWNVACYNGNMMATPSTAVYYGYYTENNLSFKSSTRFPYLSTSVPSDANAVSGQRYTGISPIGAVHTVSYKRTNIAAGMYQLDIPALDNQGYLYINGVIVFNTMVCCKSYTNVWTGYIDPSTTIEFRWINLSVNSQGALTFNPVAPVTTLATNINTNSFTANWNTISSSPAYMLDIAIDSNFTNILPNYNNLNVGNVSNYKVKSLTPGSAYYYRVRALFPNGISANSNITKAKMNEDIALPVSFLDFKASKQLNAVQLTWRTASETYNNFFTVEKSFDGILFAPIVSVKGAGNSSTVLSYSINDEDLKEGISYYRVKQTDFNNNSTYSMVACFNYTSATGITVCPNPGNSGDVMYVSLSSQEGQAVLIVVRDVQGQEYYSKAVLDAENHQLVAINPEPALAPGMYIVVASSDNSVYSQKILVK